MDSDIFATGSFIDEFIPYIDQYCGVFSGTAMWLSKQEQIMSESYSKVGGRFNWTSDGLCLGSSLFAIYNNHVLTQLLNETALTFDKYHGWVTVPADICDDIARLGMRKKRYDTAKLVNILLISRGNRLFFRDSEKLCHLGGLSSLQVGPLANTPKKGFKRIIKDFPKMLSKKGYKS